MGANIAYRTVLVLNPLTAWSEAVATDGGNSVNRTIERKHVWLGLSVLATLLGILSAARGGPIAPFGICGYLLLALVPGAALYVLVAREPVLSRSFLKNP